jgi:hypothetical protein
MGHVCHKDAADKGDVLARSFESEESRSTWCVGQLERRMETPQAWQVHEHKTVETMATQSQCSGVGKMVFVRDRAAKDD